jgi:thiamine-phosphate pyrophosphorylase
MKLIAITKPYCENDEAAFIRRLFESGFDIVHLRKPEADINYCRALLEQLTDEERTKIIVHDYHILYEEFSLKGVHINKNVTTLPKDYQGFKTRSCHSLEEVLKYKNDFD